MADKDIMPSNPARIYSRPWDILYWLIRTLLVIRLSAWGVQLSFLLTSCVSESDSPSLDSSFALQLYEAMCWGGVGEVLSMPRDEAEISQCGIDIDIPIVIRSCCLSGTAYNGKGENITYWSCMKYNRAENNKYAWHYKLSAVDFFDCGRQWFLFHRINRLDIIIKYNQYIVKWKKFQAVSAGLAFCAKNWYYVAVIILYCQLLTDSGKETDDGSI